MTSITAQPGSRRASVSKTVRLLTPTYGADLARFALLRESLLAAGCELPHLAVVQTEDLPAFRRHGFDDRVELVASAEVLPPGLDAARQRVHARPLWLRKLRRSFNKRGWGCADASYEGWAMQQIVKLLIAGRPGAEVTLTLDSDVLACSPFSLDPWLQQDRVALCCAPRDRTLQPHWQAAAGRLLGLPETTRPVWEYVAHPYAFHGERVRELQAFLEARHSRPWWAVLLDQRAGDFSEFTVYGRFVREHRALEGVFITAAGCFSEGEMVSTRWVFTAEDRARVDALIDESFADPEIHFMVLQASRRHPIEPHAARLRGHFRRMADGG